MKPYIKRAKSLSLYWLNRANDYHAAAVVLCETHRSDIPEYIVEKLGAGFSLGAALPPVIVFVMGHSLELLLKACIIEDLFRRKLVEIFNSGNKKTITDDEVDIDLPDSFYKHDLCRLTEKLGLSITLKEKKILQKFEHAVSWSGKYPIPKIDKKFSELLALKSSCMLPVVSNGSMSTQRIDPELVINLENYEKLWIKIKEHYNDIMANTANMEVVPTDIK